MTATGVICLGDVMVDVVARLPGELHPGSDRPAPIRALGGGAAANTACWLAVSGVATIMTGRIGTDPFGAWMVDDLAAYGVGDALVRDPDRPTGTCIVLVSPDGERTMVPDAGANAAITGADLPVAAFAPGRHLHLSGYTLLGGARDAGRRALSLARTHAMTVSVDAASVAPLRAAGAFLDWIGTGLTLLANRDEAALLAGTADPETAALRLAARVGVAVVKLGAGGALWSDGVELVRRPARPDVRVVDTTGAGDAFAAGYLAGFLGGAGPARSVDRGHELAARACRLVGGRPPGEATYADDRTSNATGKATEGITRTPEPPYTAVIFTSVRTDGDHGYRAMSAAMDELAAAQPGYLGIESAREGVGITVSYWRDDVAARAWKHVAEHLVAQRRGREIWYRDYRVRVATVHRDYGPNDTGRPLTG